MDSRSTREQFGSLPEEQLSGGFVPEVLWHGCCSSGAELLTCRAARSDLYDVAHLRPMHRDRELLHRVLKRRTQLSRQLGQAFPALP